MTTQALRKAARAASRLRPQPTAAPPPATSWRLCHHQRQRGPHWSPQLQLWPAVAPRPSAAVTAGSTPASSCVLIPILTKGALCTPAQLSAALFEDIKILYHLSLKTVHDAENSTFQHLEDALHQFACEARIATVTVTQSLVLCAFCDSPESMPIPSCQGDPSCLRLQTGHSSVQCWAVDMHGHPSQAVTDHGRGDRVDSSPTLAPADSNFQERFFLWHAMSLSG